MLDTVQQIQTPEGVELNLSPAGPTSRGFAWAIDFIIRLLVDFAALIILSLAFDNYLKLEFSIEDSIREEPLAAPELQFSHTALFHQPERFPLPCTTWLLLAGVLRDRQRNVFTAARLDFVEI